MTHDSHGVTTLDPMKDPRWDRFVEAHPQGWFFHLSSWKCILEETFQHMKGFYLALEDGAGGPIRAAMPVFLVKSWLTGTRLVSIPLATFSDPLVSSPDDFRLLADAALGLGKALGSSHLEIRAYRAAEFVQDPRAGRCDLHKAHLLRLVCRPEILMKKFHRTCVRQRISRAFKSGLTIEKGQKEVHLKQFYRLHFMSRKRLGLPPHPYRLFGSMWRTLAGSGRLSLLLAFADGRLASGLMLFKYKNRVSAEILGSDVRFRHMSPDHLLFWEAINEAYREGYEIFDFGRTSSGNQGLLDFKSRWHTEAVALPTFYYPPVKAKRTTSARASFLFSAAKKLVAKTPDPALGLIANLVYRHLP